MSPETLTEYAYAIVKLRQRMLCGEPSEDHIKLGPMSEQFYLLALDALNVAERNLTLATYHTMRGD